MSNPSLIISAIVLAFAGGAQADTLTVTNTSDGPAPGPVGSLRRAISDARPGDTINFALPANSSVTLTSGHLLIDKSLTISGPGANLLSVRRDTATDTPRFRIFFINGEWNVTISGLTIANGSLSGAGSVGAGIANLNGAVTITNSTLSGNSGGSGGIYNLGTLTITNSTISGNTAAYFGGGIYNERGTVNITDSTISANSSSSDGGGIHCGGGTVNVTNCTISGNSASRDGGGIHCGGGTVNVTNCTTSGNSARSYGGGILNASGTVNLTNSTISRNSANGGSGISNLGTVTITNSTLSGNTTSGANGGGIFNLGTATIANSTISGNATSGGDGGGIFNSSSGMLTARNTIVAGNTAIIGGPDVFGALTSQGHNLIGNTSGTTITGTTTGNQLNVDPKLGLLQDNGGPTFTHALLSGSTAIEGGNSFGSNTDQRGFARPVDSPMLANGGDGSDIGACEVQADLLPGCNTINKVVNNNNDSGDGSLRAVIASVCAGSTITFAPNVRGAINLTSGELLIDKFLTISGPGANLLTVQRSAAAGTPSFRIFKIEWSVIATISGVTIANGNTNAGGAGNGGGISNNGTLTLTNSVISGNTASFSSAGGILNSSGTLTIVNSTISGNAATGGFGGGIWNYSGTLTITNSTISGNSATELSLGIGVGGGIINDGGGTLTITSSTISGNTAQLRGGGIRNTSGSTVRARNTIIALNTAPTGPDVDGSLTSEGFNLIGNNSGAVIMPAQFSDQIGTGGLPIHPLLGPLQENGGPTLTRALLSGSVAIDRGDSSGLSTDQRGFVRLLDNPAISNASGGDGGDIGAFEFGGAAASLKILSITRSGNGPVVLQVAGFPHGVHRIQASADMSFGTFIDIATVTADAAGRFQYLDAVAGLTKFYRVAFP